MKSQRVVDGKVFNSDKIRQLKREAKKGGKEIEIFEDMGHYKRTMAFRVEQANKPKEN